MCWHVFDPDQGHGHFQGTLGMVLINVYDYQPVHQNMHWKKVYQNQSTLRFVDKLSRWYKKWE